MITLLSLRLRHRDLIVTRYIFLTDGDPTDELSDWQAEIEENKRAGDMWFVIILGAGVSSTVRGEIQAVVCALDGIYVEVTAAPSLSITLHHSPSSLRRLVERAVLELVVAERVGRGARRFRWSGRSSSCARGRGCGCGRGRGRARARGRGCWCMAGAAPAAGGVSTPPSSSMGDSESGPSSGATGRLTRARVRAAA